MIYYNPFTRISGYRALFVGLFLILITAIMAHWLNVHFNGNLQVTILPQRWFMFTLLQHLIPWGMYSLVFFILGFGTSKFNISFVNIAGTFALARIPLLIITLAALFPIRERALESIMIKLRESAGESAGHQISPDEIVFLIFYGLLILLMLVWLLALKYNAYRISCNLSGNKLILTFIAGVLISEALTRWLMYALYRI
jgi:hypothetical protein